MKLLVVLLALTAVTGGQAVTIREAPSSEPKLRPLIDKISSVGINGFFVVTRIFMKITESEPIRSVNKQLEKISENLQEQERELPPEMREVKEILSNLFNTFKEKAFLDFHEWNRHHYKEKEGVMEALALYVDPVASKASWCVEWLEENVKPMVIEMFQPFERHLDEALESLGSTLIKKLQEIGEILRTPLDEAAKQLRLGMETLNKHLNPYWIPFLKEYKKYDPALREWLEAPLSPPTKED
nr:PREDICTED: uncharacterized protein LOC100563250 isoform X2 [Anolis carolinensis]|eukprot:XP_016853877.1 PREDICTED: uncharacterized protein LOC100563250 isoform X2 [Anolis carolinensis]